MARQISQDVFLAAPPSQYSINPVEGAGKVVDVLKKSGTLDSLRGQALNAMKQNESLLSQIEHMLQQAELLQPGKTFSKAEADRVVANFYSRKKKQLVGLLRDTLYTVVTDESDPSGLAGRHKLLVMQTLLAELEREEMQRQQQFKQRQLQHYAQLQAEWFGHHQLQRQQRIQQQQRQAEQEQQQQLLQQQLQQQQQQQH